MDSIAERNKQILQLRNEGVSRKEVATKFELSRCRIQLIEKQDAAESTLAERRAQLREEIRTADHLDRLWPITDLLDALLLIVVTRKRLIDHFVKLGKEQLSLRELMDMCLEAPVEGFDFMSTPLLRVHGLGKKGFWSVVNRLTEMDLGERVNQEWKKRLAQIQRKYW
jgi:DNA-binding transcriptional MerR regulator